MTLTSDGMRRFIKPDFDLPKPQSLDGASPVAPSAPVEQPKQMPTRETVARTPAETEHTGPLSAPITSESMKRFVQPEFSATPPAPADQAWSRKPFWPGSRLGAKPFLARVSSVLW